jgi:hypothetical protein
MTVLLKAGANVDAARRVGEGREYEDCGDAVFGKTIAT